MASFKTYINDDPEDFIIELSNAFYIDNNNKELTNSQLQYIAYKTNKYFDTDYTDDDIFDFIHEFIKAIKAWFASHVWLSVKNKYFDMELCSSDPYGATDYTDDDHIVARKQSLMTSLISFMNSLKLLVNESITKE